MSFTTSPTALASSGGPPPPPGASAPASGLGGIATSLAQSYSRPAAQRPTTILGALAEGGQKTLLGQ